AVAGMFGSAPVRLEKAVLRANDPAEVAAVIKRFVARQCKLRGKTVDAETVVGAVRVSGRRNLAIRCERLLNMCAVASTALPFGGNGLDQLKAEATGWLRDWHAESLRQKPRPNTVKFRSAHALEPSSPLGSSTAKIVSAVVIAGTLLVGGQRTSAE